MKRLTAAASALIMAVCGALGAYAEADPIEPAETGDVSVTTAAQAEPGETTTAAAPAETTASQTVQTAPAVTTAPQQQTQLQTTAQTTAAQTTTTEVTVGRKIEPTKVFLGIGDIKDDEFDVTLNIVPDQLITNAVIKIEYDNSLMKLKESKINTAEIGGQATEENKDSTYTFTYINTKGTQYSGVYATMRFKITDKKMTESVIYVSVDKLEDNDLLDVPNNIQNGIVKYQEEPPKDDDSSEPESAKEEDSSQELPELKAKMGTLPMMLDELGVPDAKNVKSVKILDPSLAVYEQSALTVLGPGETEMIVRYNSGKELHFKLVIDKADPVSSAADTASSASEPVQDTSGRTFMIAIAILAAIAAIAIEYILIMKPFGRKAAEEDEEEEEEEFEEYDEDDDTEMVQDPEEVFARKKRPAKPGQSAQSRRPADAGQQRRPTNKGRR